MAEVRECTLPEAKLVVTWDYWRRMYNRYQLPSGVKLHIPYSLWEYRARWINAGLASDHMCGLPSNLFYVAIRVGELEPTWGTQRLRPRAYLQVGPLLAWCCRMRIRCNFARWNSGGYVRNRYSWPEPQ